jgi:hypothetical protein
MCGQGPSEHGVEWPDFNYASKAAQLSFNHFPSMREDSPVTKSAGGYS